MRTSARGGLIACACLVFALPLIGEAQEKEKPRKRHQERDGLITRIVHLMPPAFAAELKLTEEQQEQIDKLEQEFKAKRRTILIGTAFKVGTLVSNASEDEDGLLQVLDICHEITGGLLECRRTRMAYERKVVGLLDARQKEQFASLKEGRPRHLRPAIDVSEGKRNFLRDVERLQLSEEQRQKIRDLRQDMEDNIRWLLTEEQNRQLGGAKDDRCKNKKKSKG